MRDRSFLPAGGPIGLALVDAIAPAQTAALIDQVEARGFAATGGGYPADYRDNDRLVFDDDALARALFTTVRVRLPATLIEDGHVWHLAGLNRRFRACRYRAGQRFCVHRDGAHVPDDDHRSWLTLQLYLDDGATFTGGRTRFYADRAGAVAWAAIAPVAGTAIVFDHRAWHDGEAVTAGTKRVLRTDVMYARGARVARAGASARAELGRHRGYVWSVIARRDGTIASSGRDGAVRTWGPAARVHELAASSVTALVETADERLWCGTRAGALFVIDDRGARLVATDLGAVLGLAPCAGGVAVASARGEVIAIAPDGTVRWRAAVDHGWTWAVIAADDGLIACGDDGAVVAIDRAGTAHTIASLATRLRALARAPDGALLVGDDTGQVTRLGPDGAIRAQVAAHAAAVTALAVRADGTWASASEDERVRCWRDTTATGAWTATDFVTALAFSATGALVCGGYDGAVWPVDPDAATAA